MSAKAALFVLGMLCLVWATLSFETALIALVQRYQKYIDDIKEDIGHKMDAISTDEFLTMISLRNILWIQVYLIHNGLEKNMTMTLNNTRDLIDAAAAEGKDAEHCFAITSQNLTDVNLYIKPLLYECVNSSNFKFNDESDYIPTMKKNIDILNDYLDNAFMNCIVTGIYLRDCVTRVIEGVKESVENFNVSYEFYNRIRTMSINYIIDSVKVCFVDVVAKAKWEIHEITDAAEKCMENS